MQQFLLVTDDQILLRMLFLLVVAEIVICCLIYVGILSSIGDLSNSGVLSDYQTGLAHVMNAASVKVSLLRCLFAKRSISAKRSTE